MDKPPKLSGSKSTAVRADDSFCDSALPNLDGTGAIENANMDLDQEIALIDRFLGDALRQIMKDK
jgi:hypothetical protein